MRSLIANEEDRLLFWARVREFAVPPHMIRSATDRRATGDWAGACAAARVDVDIHPRTVARTHGRELAARVRDDLRHLAPDLLRWHMPRIAPDGLLRPGLTVTLAAYHPPEPGGGVIPHLVARTAPGWADAGQRISLALWDPARPGDGTGAHPHPRPDRRFRLDLHRHLWDARRTGELRDRAVGRCGGETRSGDKPWSCDKPWSGAESMPDQGAGMVPPGSGCAVDRWADEATILLRAERRAANRAESRADGPAGRSVVVRLDARHRLVLHLGADGDEPRIRDVPAKGLTSTLPVLPDASVRTLPDLELLRAGRIGADRLHPLVASALVPDRPRSAGPPIADHDPRLITCRGDEHRIGLVDGVLVPLDHGPDEIRREELLAALGGTPLPCLRVIDEAHRHPECLDDVRGRLDHGDTAGALAVLENLLGPAAHLRSGALRDELEAAALGRITHGLFRAGLADPGPAPSTRDRRHRNARLDPRRAVKR